MIIIQPGLPFSFNYGTFDQATGLFVAASIYDISTGSPVFLSKVNMSEIASGVYAANYLGATGKAYLAIALVYTDGTYATIDTNRAPSSEIYKSSDMPVSFIAFNYGLYNQDPALNIAASVYDVTTGVPGLVQSVIMAVVIGGIYFGVFSGNVNHVYEILKLVYTNNTFMTVDTNYSPSQDTLQCIVLSGNGAITFRAGKLIGQASRALLKERIND